MSATLEFDVIDGDDTNVLTDGFDVYAGFDTSGTLIGTGFAPTDNGGPGSWVDFSHANSDHIVLIIASSLFADLADGTFDVYVDEFCGCDPQFWGSNQAILTINFTPPVVILGAEVNLRDTTILISGINFGSTAVFSGVVKLFAPMQGEAEPQPVFFSRSDYYRHRKTMRPISAR